MLRIYAFPAPNNSKVVIAAEEAGLEYELVRVDLAKGEQRTADHLARHPLGKTPAIEHDDLTLFESNAICRYLGSLGEGGLYPVALRERALVDQWVEFLTQHPGRWLLQFYWEEVIKPGFFKQPADPAALAEAQGFLDQQLPVLEAQLGRGDFLAGAAFSIADIIGYSQVVTTDATSADLSAYPNIQRWLESIRARPAVQRAEARLAGR